MADSSGPSRHSSCGCRIGIRQSGCRWNASSVALRSLGSIASYDSSDCRSIQQLKKPAKATSVRSLTVMLQGMRCTCSWRHPKKSSVGIGSRLRRIGTRNRSFSKMGSAVIDRLITDRRGLGGSPDPTGKQPQRKYRLGSSRATAGYRKSKHVWIRYAGRNFPIRSLSRPKRRVLSSVPAAREENT